MKTVQVNASRSYEVKIESGLLDSLGDEVVKFADGKVLVVTDENVAPLYLARAYRSLKNAGFSVSTTAVPAGEGSKDIKYYVNLLNLLGEKGFSRSDTVIALGGGVVGDLTGFVAATYLRGIRFIQVPTTLLAMVDSSVGGKTALNLQSGKNQVGAFYQPSLVLCDTELLRSLPEAVFRAGCAEVIKMAILFDEALFEHLNEYGLDFDREMVIARCVELKRDVVCADEYDTGARQLLNLGHTVGHGIEKMTDFIIPHGEAVAVGCAIFARAFAEDAQKIVSVFEKFLLPVKTEFSAEVLANAAFSDKKRQGGEITLAIARHIGRGELMRVRLDELREIIEAGL